MAHTVRTASGTRLPADFRPDQFSAQYGGAATLGAFVHMMLMSPRLNRRNVELCRGKVRQNSAGMDGIVSFSLHTPAWIHRDSRLNQSGIAQICSLINLESLLYFP